MIIKQGQDLWQNFKIRAGWEQFGRKCVELRILAGANNENILRQEEHNNNTLTHLYSFYISFWETKCQHCVCSCSKGEVFQRLLFEGLCKSLHYICVGFWEV